MMGKMLTTEGTENTEEEQEEYELACAKKTRSD